MKQWFPLAGLMLAAFIFNTSEFIPIGLLSDIAADFGISESHAGMMITIYAWVLAPSWAVRSATGRASGPSAMSGEQSRWRRWS